MVKYMIASQDDMELLMRSRLEMLRVVNELPPEYRFDAGLVERSQEYFENGNQTTVLALDGEKTAGCATLCYMEMMPTFSHPTGKRAHLMNVYTAREYRRQGIALRMLELLIEEARKKGVTEISLDATEEGRTLYRRCGFVESAECMVLSLKDNAK